ncbi:MAG: ATP-binding cassette domain-containing protein, partial [Nitrospirae bacterium]|nr:ATP-binding cassette domain-containing protein [Nitrospirota bacterium]
MSDTALACTNVSKSFKKGERFNSLRDLLPSALKSFFLRDSRLRLGEFWALKDISFDVTRGEAFGIIGPNGAGKSTLLKLIAKILVPNTGAIKVSGRLAALIELGAGFHPDLTGRENIYLNGAILGMKRREIDRRFESIVEFSALSGFLETPLRHYSSGMFARLGFAVATHVDADILLIDEVLSVGDAGFQVKCISKMHELIANGKTVVFISHNVRQVARLCNRVLVLSKGEAAALTSADNAINLYYSLVSGTSSKDSGAQNKTITVTPTDAHRNPVESVPFGDDINLLVRCTLPAGFPRSYLIVKVGNHYGVDFLSFNSERAGIEICPGTVELLCQIENPRLLPNRYRITAWLMDTLTGQVIDYFLHQGKDLIIEPPGAEILKILPNPEATVFDSNYTWTVMESK